MDLIKAKLSIEKLKEIQKQADQARGAILIMTTLAGSGHPGGSMSTIDFLLMLLHMANIDPKNPKWEKRDRIIISHGHVSPAAYSAFGLMGFFNMDDAISQFRLAGSIFEGHVEPAVPGIEWASGNLGQGLSAGCGFALACHLKKINTHTFVLMGDGEQQKGQVSEAHRFAVKYRLKNITAFVDYNKLQICGRTEKIMPQDILENYVSDGWGVIEIDGHDLVEIRDSIIDAVCHDKPTMILAHTVMGKGVSFMENKEKYHGAAISEEQLNEALKELGLRNDIEKYKELREKFKPSNTIQKEKNKDFKLKTGKQIIYEERTDNRSAWGNAIADIAYKNDNAPIVIFDCDLQGSVKTKKFESILPQNFFQGGIMEHNTAVTAGAMSKEGLQVFFADFGVFGVDETFNQHRLNDINNTNLKIITTHVGLDVGEDGKTHQCIDYLGVMKNLYHFKVIIPADPNQTDLIIRYISSKYGNFLIPMGRSKMDIIKNEEGKIFFGKDYKFEYGKADLLRNGTDAALITMGTLTGRAVEIAEKLKNNNIFLQLWNISCLTELDENALKKAAQTGTIFTYEDHNIQTGLGNSIADKLMELGLNCKFHKFGVEDYGVSGKSNDLFKFYKLDVDSMVKKIKNLLS
ncbi:MAG: transketolase [Candidatus Cloacimonetes bacterium]|nr:transketolase [Candidatus Cloacimonadota bacterium]